MKCALRCLGVEFGMAMDVATAVDHAIERDDLAPSD
jgi:hypothetical protein